MNLAETIKRMGKPQESLDESNVGERFQSAEAELAQYARKEGGIDKADFMAVAKMLGQIGRANILNSGQILSKLNRKLSDMDTDPRDKVYSVLKSKGLYESIEIAEDGHTDVASAKRQCKTIIEDAQAIMSALDSMDDEGSLPTWWTNKLAVASTDLNKMNDYISNPNDDEEEMDENVGAPQTAAHRRAQRNPSKSGGTGYDLYHKDFSSAMKHAYDYAKSKLGVDIDPKEIDDKVASGPRKPSKGKTNSYRLMGKDGKKAVQIQVHGMPSGHYELNMYKESFEMELDENKNLIKDYQDMKATGKKDHNILDVLMSMPKYKRMSKDQMAKIIGDAKRKGIFKEEVELDEAKSKEQQIADLEKMLDRISGNTSSVKMKKFALQRKIDKLKNEELEEAYKTPAEAGAYEAGKKAARAGKKYDDNPNKKGSKEHTAWSKGHNEARAKGMKEEVELEELKKYDKNADYRLLNRLSQKAKTGNLTPAEKSQMANAKSRLRNHGFSEEVELDEAMRVLAKKGRTKVVTKGDGVALVMVGNKEVASGDLDDGAGGWFMSRPGEKGQKFFDSPKKIVDFYAEEVEMSEEVNLDELFESAFEEELAEAKYQVDIKGAGRATVMARTEKEAIDKASRKMGVRTHGKKNEIEVKLVEESETDRYGNTSSFLDAIMNVVSEKKELDPVNKKALKKDFDDRKDKDIDNDGDTDDSDEYLHKKRQAVSKAIEKDSDKAEAEQEKEVSDKEDEPKGKVGKSNKQTKVDVNPSIEEEKGEEMTSAEMEKKDEIMKSLEKKKDEFVKKYGDRAKEVMARTAIKMAKKHA